MGVGFAIPVKQAAAALSDFFTPEWTDSVWFGAKVRAGPHPLTVTAVQPGSPADKAGLKGGDVIVEFGGQKIANIYDYTYALDAARIGQSVEIVVVREGKRTTVTVTPEARK